MKKKKLTLTEEKALEAAYRSFRCTMRNEIINSFISEMYGGVKSAISLWSFMDQEEKYYSILVDDKVTVYLRVDRDTNIVTYAEEENVQDILRHARRQDKIELEAALFVAREAMSKATETER
ncbi:MAG: hypothetical protein DELT_00768 [Desulfovibrio sp.]